MPTTMTFDTLKQDMTRYLQRGSATTDATVFAQIPRLINAAERKISQVVKLQGFIEILTSALQTGNPIVSKPDRWRETIAITYASGSNRTPLYPRDLEFCQQYWPDATLTNADNPPRYYADADYQHWYISPTPDQAYTLQVTAYFQPPLLDDANQSNFLCSYCPNLLLYSALLEATPFLKDDARLQIWAGLQAQEFQTLTGQDAEKIIDRTAERNRA